MGQNDVTFKLGVDATSIERGLTGVAARTKSFGHEVLASFTGAFAVGAIVERFSELSTRLRDLQRTAKELGVSFEFLQVAQYGATKMGGSAEDVTVAIEKLNLKIGEAQTTSEEAAKAFKDAGIALVNVNGTARTTEEIFRAIADKIKNTGDASMKAALAHEFFGRSANNIRGILDQGSAALDQFGQKARDSGKIVSEEFAAQINTLTMAVKSNASVFETWAGAAATLFNAPGAMAGNLVAFIEDADRLKKEIKELKAIVDDDTHRQVYGEKNKELANIKASDDAKKRRELEVKEATLNALEKKRAAELLRVGKEFEVAQRDTEKEASQFAVNDALRKELGLRLQLESMSFEDPKRAALMVQIQKAGADVTRAELAGKQAALRAQIEMAGKLEQEIKAMGDADDVKLEKEKKKVELAKMQKEIAAGALDIEKIGIQLKERQLSLQRAQATTEQGLKEAKADRTKYTLQELVTGNPNGVQNEALRAEILKAQEADRLEKMGDRERLRGNTKEADRLYNEKDSILNNLKFLKGNERPFKQAEDTLKEINQQLEDIKKKQDALPKTR